MRLVWERAAKKHPDFYLWLNDDAMLFDGALETLLATWRKSGSRDTVVVGSCCDPTTGKLTYGGQHRTSRHPARLQAIPPEGAPINCDTFQSNVLLVPRATYDRIGMVHSFQHAMGDTDYGYRATKAGCRCLVAPGFLAACEANTNPTYRKRGPSQIQRWRLLNSRKGLPFADWLFFVRRHGGRAWPIYWVGPYIRVLLNL
jgi:GT2 family glycosyltransferase